MSLCHIWQCFLKCFVPKQDRELSGMCVLGMSRLRSSEIDIKKDVPHRLNVNYVGGGGNTNERYGTELTMRTELGQHYYYHWVDTSAGRVLGSKDIIHPVVKASTMT